MIRVIKVFLIGTSLAFLLTGGLPLLFGSLPDFMSIIFAATFGFSMTIIACLLNRGKTSHWTLTSPVQSRTEELEVSSHTAFNYCLEVLRNYGTSIKIYDDATRVIIAQTPLKNYGWRQAFRTRFGERLSLRIDERGEGRSRVHILSSPRLKRTLIDYGDGIENVESILRMLKEKTNS